MTQDLDRFDQLVYDALQSDEQPSSDFTASVMARVAQTPQRKPIRYGRIAAGIAACLVLAFVATIPMRWRAGSAAPKAAGSTAAEPAAIEESMMIQSAPAAGADEAAAEEAERSETVSGAASPAEAERSDSAAANGAESYDTAANSAKQYAGIAPPTVPLFETADSNSRAVAAYRITDDKAVEEARTWLADHGYVDDGGYVLHADDVVKLNEAVEGLDLPEGDCVLILGA